MDEHKKLIGRYADQEIDDDRLFEILYVEVPNQCVGVLDVVFEDGKVIEK